MAQELVKYHNDFNKVKIPSFTAQEQNILMGIISKIRDLQDDKIITFYPDELKEFSTKNYTNDEILSIVRILRDKFFKADFTIIKEYKNAIAEEIFNLFNKFTIYKNIETLEIERVELSVNSEFSYLLNDLLGNFTSFQLSEFIALKSKYSKSLYRILKQYKNTGKCLVYKNDWQGFCAFMDIPTNYRLKDIDNRVLQPAILELGGERNLFTEIDNKIPIFENLSYKKIKDPKGRGRGGKVIGIEFYFTPYGEVEQATTTNTEQTLEDKTKNWSIPAQKNNPKMLKTWINPISGETTTEADIYIDRYFKTHNELLSKQYYTDVYDECKIKKIIQYDDGKIIVKSLNMSDDKTQNSLYIKGEDNESLFFTMSFNDFEHFKNWFEKHKI